MTMSPNERTDQEVKPLISQINSIFDIGRMKERTNEESVGMESNDLGKTS